MMSESISEQDFELFKEALTEENLEQQVLIVLRLQSLAKALGEKSTRDDLLPFLTLHYVELHDEVLLNIAEQLIHFIPLVGGFDHASIIFTLLGRISVTDENIVRERAVRTMIALQETMSTQQIEELLLPVVNALTTDDWFTSKCSAVMLFSPLYPKLSDTKRAELRNSFKTLIQDDSPMVRKAAATACVDFVQVVEDVFLKTEFVPIFQDIAQDPMDSVRSGTIDIALALMKRVGEEDVEESILKTIEDSCDDPSWRLRQRLALNLATLQQQIPDEKYRGTLLSLYQKLAEDLQAEVRVIAASNLFRYCGFLKESYQSDKQSENNFEPVFEQSIMTIIQKLALDECEEVRLGLSSNILPLSTLLSERCFEKNIVSFLLQVLSREESIMIQTNFLLGLSSLSGNVDLTQSLGAIKNSVNAVIERSQANWRTRRSILLTLIDISKFCDASYFSDNFQMYYTTLLGDPVFAVRRSASLILPIISKHYGIKWASDHLVPSFTKFSQDSRYLYRFVSLFGIVEMISPHLLPEPNSYLEDFRKLVENKTEPDSKAATRALVKILKSCHLVQKELSEEKYQMILRLKDELNYASNYSSDVYIETEFEMLKHQKLDIYSLQNEDLHNSRTPYLQGVLKLIFNKFLPIISYLNKDPTENVQIGAVCTLGIVSDFITKLSKEESQEWVQESLKSLTPQEIASILDEIEEEFKPTQPDQDNELIKEMNEEVPNLSKTVTIENSNKSEELGASLIQDVLDAFDKKISDARTVLLKGQDELEETVSNRPKFRLREAEKRVLPLL